MVALLALGLLAIACGSGSRATVTPSPTPSPVPTPADLPSFQFFGQGPNGGLVFHTDGPFSISLIGGGITAANTDVLIRVYTSGGPGADTLATASVTGGDAKPPAPPGKAGSLAPLAQQDIGWTFDLGPGDFIVDIQTDPQVAWQAVLMSETLIIGVGGGVAPR